jgi:hypothetical protein
MVSRRFGTPGNLILGFLVLKTMIANARMSAMAAGQGSVGRVWDISELL